MLMQATQIQKSQFRQVGRFLGSIAFGIILMLGAVVMLPVLETRADGPDKAYIVIQFDENTAIVRPISFTAPISGYAALQMTSLSLSTSDSGFGPAVCAIEGVGDAAANCFGTGYWAYSFWNGSAWEDYPVGANSSTIAAGAIELWAWSPAYTPPPTPASGPQFVAVTKAINWLAGQKQTNGSYGSPSSTAEVVTAFGANRQATKFGGVGYLLATGANASDNDPALSAKLAIGLSAVESCWPNGGLTPTDYYSATTGAYGFKSLGSAGRQAWAILGAKAISNSVPTPAIDLLKSKFVDHAGSGGGGWEWEDISAFPPDTNTTALAVQALVATGESVTSSTEISKALLYFKAAQNADGGFSYDPDVSAPTSDVNSTAYIVQALIAAGEDPLSSPWTISGTNPVSYLLSKQLPDGRFQGSNSDQLSTQQAIPALLGYPLPIKETALPACKQIFLPGVAKNSWF